MWALLLLKRKRKKKKTWMLWLRMNGKLLKDIVLATAVIRELAIEAATLPNPNSMAARTEGNNQKKKTIEVMTTAVLRANSNFFSGTPPSRS